MLQDIVTRMQRNIKAKETFPWPTQLRCPIQTGGVENRQISTDISKYFHLTPTGNLYEIPMSNRVTLIVFSSFSMSAIFPSSSEILQKKTC